MTYNDAKHDAKQPPVTERNLSRSMHLSQYDAMRDDAKRRIPTQCKPADAINAEINPDVGGGLSL
ncbi:MAG: hypothetical protein CMJ78_11855 [Planctomycetaceae bacterium]|nr:hypothetical protein [Planctomycetaceae bacterium]